MYPMISVITPTTKNRMKFIELMLSNISSQDYPHNRLEWLVVGDDTELLEKTFLQAFEIPKMKDINCRFIPCDISGDIGRKRNFACEQSRYDVFASMDDDDIYHPGYLTHSITEMNNLEVDMVGSRDMLVFYPLSGGVMRYVKGNNIHEATIVCRKSHWNCYKFKEGEVCGEGRSLVEGSYNNEMDVRKLMVCLSHESNTFDKSRLLLKCPPVLLREKHREGLMRIYEDKVVKRNKTV